MAYRHFGLPVASLAAVLAVAVGTAAAKSLDAETCARIKGDIQGLEQQGIRDLMAKGPQTAKSLNTGQLEKIRTLMDLDGQARFRCGERAFITLKEEPPEEPQDAGAAPGSIDNATPGITLPRGAQSIGPVVPPVKRRPPPPLAKAAAPAKAAAGVKAAPPKAKAAAALPAAPAAATETAPPPVPKAKSPPPKKVDKSKSDDAYRPTVTPPTE